MFERRKVPQGAGASAASSVVSEEKARKARPASALMGGALAAVFLLATGLHLHRAGTTPRLLALRGGATSDTAAVTPPAVPRGEPPPQSPPAKVDKLAPLTMLRFDESLPWLRYVRTHGVLQLIAVLERLGKEKSDELLWGDEIEYHVVALDEAARTVRLCLRAPELLKELNAKEETHGRSDGFGEASSWHPEYAAWMLESTPRVPYGGYTADLCRVEASMRLRRARLAGALRPGEAALTIPAFPLVGVGEFYTPVPLHHPRPTPHARRPTPHRAAGDQAARQ